MFFLLTGSLFCVILTPPCLSKPFLNPTTWERYYSLVFLWYSTTFIILYVSSLFLLLILHWIICILFYLIFYFSPQWLACISLSKFLFNWMFWEILQCSASYFKDHFGYNTVLVGGRKVDFFFFKFFWLMSVFGYFYSFIKYFYNFGCSLNKEY